MAHTGSAALSASVTAASQAPLASMSGPATSTGFDAPASACASSSTGAAAAPDTTPPSTMLGRRCRAPRRRRSTTWPRRWQALRTPSWSPGPDIDASGAWDAAVALAEKAALPVWATPAPGGGRIGFPEGHPHFRGVLPPAIGPVGETLAGHDLILVAGSSVFPYYPNIPGPLLPEGARLVVITNDPDEAARAPMGDALVADVRLTLEALVAALPATDRTPPQPLDPPFEVELTDPMNASTAMRALGEVFPDNGIVVLEAPSATLALRNQLRLSKPGSYYFGAGAAWASGSAPPSACRWPSPIARRCASSARAARSTRSRRSGAPPPTRCRSRCSCCATRSTRS